MTAYNVVDPAKLQALQPEDITVVLANLQAIAAAINGALDNGNLSPGAAIAISKLAGYPADSQKVLLGNGTWANLGTGTVGESVPTATVLQFAGAVAPADFLLCDGSAVARGTYPDLFNIIGVLYGVGDGSTTFNVPDIQGRMVVGKGTHVDVDTLGESDGLPVSNRTPRHGTTSSLSIARTADVAVAEPGHQHAPSAASPAGTDREDGQAYRGVSWDWTTVPQPTAVGYAGTYVSQQPSFSLNGSIGAGGGRPQDAPASIVLNHIIKT